MTESATPLHDREGPSPMTFHDLHQDELPLLLPNAWDLPSAIAFADAGFVAVGTTSFGIAASGGDPDGGRASRDGTTALAHALADLPVYVSVDIEDGYADDPERVGEYVAGLGVAGVNIEDSSGERLIGPTAHAEKVAAVKRHAPEVYVNARVDTYWLGQDADPESTLRRALRYVDAGADGVFVPGATDPDLLRWLATSIAVPVNVLPVPGLSLSALADLGIRRVSTGSLPYRAAIDASTRAAVEIRAGREGPSATSYPELQQRLLHLRRGMT